MKKIKLAALSLSLSLAYGTVCASESLANRYNLPQNEPVTIKGNLITTLKLDCLVRSESLEGNTINFAALKDGAIINGFILAEGQTTSAFVHIGAHVQVELPHGAKVGVTNVDPGLVNLYCK